VWQCIITLDDSWFYSEIGWEQQWLAEDHQPRTKTRRGIDHDKKMLKIFSNPKGTHLIDAMPKREKHSTRYYVDNILTVICQRLIPAGQGK
jgi:hypothetical protein